MSASKYPIGTLADMAAIPDEALPRFLAELPSILREVRKMAEINALLARVAGVPVELGAPLWVDDDLNEFRSTFTVGEEEIGSLAFKREP